MGRRRVGLQTAAELLSISSDAVRKRAKRGTMPHETGEDGRLYVWVDAGRTGADEPDHDREVRRDELVEELRNRVRYLEEGPRRKDHLLAAALERIPAIVPPQEPRGSPQTDADEAEGHEPLRRRAAPRAKLVA
jgi:hypothetical protein